MREGQEKFFINRGSQKQKDHEKQLIIKKLIKFSSIHEDLKEMLQ